jgi:hypothetical protein
VTIFTTGREEVMVGVGYAACVAGVSGVGMEAPYGMVRVAHTVWPALVQVLVVVYTGMAAS